MGAGIGGGERVGGRQGRGGIGAGELHGPGVAGRDVAVGVFGGDREREGRAGRDGRGRHPAEHEGGGRGRDHVERRRGRRRQAPAGEGERVAGPHLRQGQAGEVRHAVDHSRRQGAAQGAAAGVVPQGDGHLAAVAGDHVAEVVLDRDRQPEADAGRDGGGLDGRHQSRGQAVRGQVGDEGVRDGGTSAGDQVVAGAGAVGAIAAGGDVVEVARGEAVEGGQGLAGTVEGRPALGHAALVGDGDQAGPGGRREVRVGVIEQRRARVVVRVVDRDSGIRVGVERDVGGGPREGGLDALLIGRLAFILAGAAGRVGPGGLAGVRSVRIQAEGGAADGQHVRRGRGIRDHPVLARGGHEGDALVAARRGEVGVVGRLAAPFGPGEVHQDDRHAGERSGGRRPGEQVAVVVAVAFDEVDPGSRGNGVHPFHAEGRAELPAAGRIGGGQGRRGALLVEEREAGGGEAEYLVELPQVAEDVGVAVSLDDRDGLARARPGGRPEGDLVDPVGGVDLVRGVAREPDVERAGGRRGQAAALGRERVAGAGEVQVQAGEGRHAVDRRDRQRAPERAVPRVAGQGDRHVAAE